MIITTATICLLLTTAISDCLTCESLLQVEQSGLVEKEYGYKQSMVKLLKNRSRQDFGWG